MRFLSNAKESIEGRRYSIKYEKYVSVRIKEWTYRASAQEFGFKVRGGVEKGGHFERGHGDVAVHAQSEIVRVLHHFWTLRRAEVQGDFHVEGSISTFTDFKRGTLCS